MGTNYYARVMPCKHCNLVKTEDHIGKSSAGWTFTFHATDEIKSYKQWLKFLKNPDTKIYDEYDRECSLEDFKHMVKVKKDAKYKHAIESDDDSYLDEEGNSMSPHGFS